MIYIYIYDIYIYTCVCADESDESYEWLTCKSKDRSTEPAELWEHLDADVESLLVTWHRHNWLCWLRGWEKPTGLVAINGILMMRFFEKSLAKLGELYIYIYT